MNTKQQLIITWSNINKQINSIQSTINNIESSAEIIPLAEKINILNQSIQSATIETLNLLLDVEHKNPLMCDVCHCKLNLIEDTLSCENPICELNA